MYGKVIKVNLLGSAGKEQPCNILEIDSYTNKLAVTKVILDGRHNVSS